MKIKHESFKNFDLAYCITVHKAQGSTYNFEYSIYEYEMFDSKLLYTAMSRSTKKSFINFIKHYPQTTKGFIYKVTNENGKVYIGSTNEPAKRWKEHQESKETDKFHLEMRALPNSGWKFEVIQEVEYIDIETLWIHEATQILKHDSIKNGFNSKIPVDMSNLF